MDKKIANIKERVLQVAKYKGIGYEKFASIIGMTYASFKGQQKTTPINSNALDILLSEFPDISAEWLITGKGNMIKDPQSVTGASNSPPGEDVYKALWEQGKEDIHEKDKEIARLNTLIGRYEERLASYREGDISPAHGASLPFHDPDEDPRDVSAVREVPISPKATTELREKRHPAGK